ncbi:MAG: helix-turn-helix domain-containing protein [Lachnospiraceae bacterium]|nr:helix-turn-helix domain-containing protein [Lachnospiraceae bacterium]
MIEGYITVTELAKKWGITVRTVQTMCSEGRIPGVTKFGNAWAIPSDAIKPTDGRITTGEYKDWRKKKVKKIKK